MQRMTRQRVAVIDELNRQDAFRSAQQIHDDLVRQGERIGLATVYRNLQALCDEGQVDTLRGEDTEVLYRLCLEQNHHHHLVCKRCGRAEDFSLNQVESWLKEIATQHNYTNPTHSIEIYGTCQSCQGGK